MRVNMSMAIVSMTEPGAATTYNWTMQIQSVILSSFFWGYVVLQVPGGQLANRVGGKMLLAAALGVNSLVVLIIPVCAQYGGWKLLCVCRAVQGLTQGLVFPSVHEILSKWVPVEEQSRLGPFTYAGTHLGTALQLATAGYVADIWGWPMIFQSVGVLGILWTLLYLYLGSSSPQSSTYISAEERNYIQSSLGCNEKCEKHRTPWKSILTSKPFIALVVVHCGQNWGFWTLLAEMPSYMKLVLGIDIKSNGILSALPYLMLFTLSFPFSIVTEYILKRQWLSLSTCRKLSNSIGMYGAAAALVALCCVPPSNTSAAVALLVAAVGVNAGHMTGFLLVHIDMAPEHAGTMMGITNCVSNIVSIIAPLVAGAIISDETDPAQWHKVFYLASAVYVATNSVFVVLGSSLRQHWEAEQTIFSDEVTEKAVKLI
ncbi:hypothetical protein ACJJTC_005330 [Scirpophaga incertulas]